MPFGIGRALKRGGRAIAKPFEQAGREIERAGDRVVGEVRRTGRKTRAEVRRGVGQDAYNFGANLGRQVINPGNLLLNTLIPGAGNVAALYGATEETMVQHDVAKEERQAQQLAERQEKERAKAQAERGAELLRRRRTRRLTSGYTPQSSGFMQAGTSTGTVLGI